MGRSIKICHKNTAYTNQDSDGTKGKLLTEKIYKDTISEIWTKKYKNDSGDWKLSRTKKDWDGRQRESFVYRDIYTDVTLNLSTATQTTLDDENHMLTKVEEYDFQGNALEITHPSGEKYYSTYSSTGNIEKTSFLQKDGSYPDDLEITSIANYDLNNNIIVSQDRRGIRAHFYYNDVNSIDNQYTESIPSVNIFTKYCHLGPMKVSKYEDDNLIIQTEKEYNQLGENSITTQTIDNMSRTILNEYDSEGQPASVTITGLSGYEKSFTTDHIYYGSTGQDLTYTSSSAVFEGLDPDVQNDTPLFIKKTEYNGESSLTYKNNKISNFENRSEEGFMNLTKIEHDSIGEDITKVYGDRDWVGNILEIDADSYTYDGMGRIKTAEGLTYYYDDFTDDSETSQYENPNAINNIRKIKLDSQNYKEYSYDDEDAMRMTQFKEVVSGQDVIDWSYSYDKQGNVVEVGDRFNQLKWDGQNRLREIEYYPDEFNRIRKDRYWYNASGLRFKKEEYIGLTTNTERTYYMYNGDDVILEEKFIGGKPVKAKYSVGKSAQYQANFEEGE